MLQIYIRPFTRWILVTFLVISMNFLGWSQDIHYSQFYNSPMNINPGLTGIFNGDIRLGALYRSQWYVDNLGRYMTFTAAADAKFYPKDRSRNHFWSGGLMFNYDVAGDSKLSLGYLGLQGSFTAKVDKENFITLGGSLGVAQRRFRLEDLLWDNQWNGFQVDPTAPSGENFDNTSRYFLDLGAGFNWRWQRSSRTKMDIGFGAFHLNRPEQSYLDNAFSDNLPMRLSAHLISSFKFTDYFDLLVHGNVQFQDPFDEVVIGAMAKGYLNVNRGREFAVSFGAGYRFGDAIIPKVALDISSWHAEFSYDINISDFEVATRGRGGPEFSLIYIITKVPPLGQFKNCPLY